MDTHQNRERKYSILVAGKQCWKRLSLQSGLAMFQNISRWPLWQNTQELSVSERTLLMFLNTCQCPEEYSSHLLKYVLYARDHSNNWMLIILIIAINYFIYMLLLQMEPWAMQRDSMCLCSWLLSLMVLWDWVADCPLSLQLRRHCLVGNKNILYTKCSFYVLCFHPHSLPA